MLTYSRGVLYFCTWLSCVYFGISQYSCINRQLYYVASNGSDSVKCLTPGHPDHPCATLPYLVQHINQCSTVEIMNDLTLNNTVLLLRFANISIVGSSKTGQLVTVQCEGNSGILLQSLTGFYLQGLHFIGCSFDFTPYQAFVPRYDSKYTSVCVKDSSNVHISGCSFDNHRGSSIILVNVYLDITVENSNFTGNKSLLDDTEIRSGGIVVRFYRVWFITYPVRVRINTCNFNSNFHKNINDTICIDRQEDGGAIDIKHDVGRSSLNISIENCRFQHNVAINGGAVSVITSGSASVSILNSLFFNNFAFCQGGALKFAHYNLSSGLCKLELIECRFTNNRAYWGGALSVVSDVCNGCSSFTSINFTNNVFTYNKASGSGHAIALSGPDLVDSSENEKSTSTPYFLGLMKYWVTEEPAKTLLQ